MLNNTDTYDIMHDINDNLVFNQHFEFLQKN